MICPGKQNNWECLDRQRQESMISKLFSKYPKYFFMFCNNMIIPFSPHTVSGRISYLAWAGHWHRFWEAWVQLRHIFIWSWARHVNPWQLWSFYAETVTVWLNGRKCIANPWCRDHHKLTLRKCWKSLNLCHTGLTASHSSPSWDWNEADILNPSSFPHYLSFQNNPRAKVSFSKQCHTGTSKGLLYILTATPIEFQFCHFP